MYFLSLVSVSCEPLFAACCDANAAAPLNDREAHYVQRAPQWANEEIASGPIKVEKRSHIRRSLAEKFP